MAMPTKVKLGAFPIDAADHLLASEPVTSVDAIQQPRTADEVLDALPEGSMLVKTATGFSVNRATGNGFQHGAGPTVADALADIGAWTAAELKAIQRDR